MIQKSHFWVYTQKKWKHWCIYLYVDVHSSVIHNKQKVEAIQVSTEGWRDKQNVIYTCNRSWFSLEKEGNFDTCCNLGKLWGHYTKWKKPVTKDKRCTIPLIWDIYNNQNHRNRKEGGCQGLGERGTGSYCSLSYEFQLEKTRRWWWLHNSVSVLNATEL